MPGPTPIYNDSAAPMNELIDLARHMEWADAVVWRAVLQSEAALADRRVLILLYHVHVVQRAFVAVWRGETPHFPDPSEFPNPRSLARFGREGHEQIQDFLGNASLETLAREVRLPWAEEIAATRTREVTHPTLKQTVMQVFMHSTHHRGQINARVRELGGEPPLTDFIAWIWLGQPPSEWPAPPA
jgi:uncharacterized damage-inducible protein DinB